MGSAVIVAAAVVGGLAGWAVRPVVARWVQMPMSVAVGASGAGSAAMGWRFDDEPVTAAAYTLLVVALVALVWIDLHCHRLPREISYPAALAGAGLLAVAALVHRSTDDIIDLVVGALATTAVLWLVYLLGRGGLGDGDVRMAPLLGAFLGFEDLGLILIALLVASIVGGVVATVVLVRSGDRHRTIPFGPFLAAGTVVAILASDPLLDIAFG